MDEQQTSWDHWLVLSTFSTVHMVLLVGLKVHIVLSFVSFSFKITVSYNSFDLLFVSLVFLLTLNFKISTWVLHINLCLHGCFCSWLENFENIAYVSLKTSIFIVSGLGVFFFFPSFYCSYILGDFVLDNANFNKFYS